MNTIIVLKFTSADLMPAAAGILIFISIILAGSVLNGHKFLAWILGFVAQGLLIAFGVITGHFGFYVNALAAVAFGVNVWKATRKPRLLKSPTVISDEAREQLEKDITKYREGGIIR